MNDQPIRDAATLILLRREGDECRVLLGMRGAKAVFMPSKYVFPGGAVDPQDSQAPLAAGLRDIDARRLSCEPLHKAPATPHALAAAALRELAEETGLLIGSQTGGPASSWPGYAETGLSPDAGALRYVFRAITPPGRPRRFDARFFVADAATIAGDPDDFSRACDELSHLHWVRAREAQSLDLPFITKIVLAEVMKLAEATPGHAPLPVPDKVPFFDNRDASPRFIHIS